MDIKVRLSKNFQTAYNRLSEKYGEEMAYLNGFGDKQLSYTDFIDNFIDKDTVADASVDGNSNVGNKDMRTLMNEMPFISFRIITIFCTSIYHLYNSLYHMIHKKEIKLLFSNSFISLNHIMLHQKRFFLNDEIIQKKSPVNEVTPKSQTLFDLVLLCN